MAKFSKDSSCELCNLHHNIFKYLTDEELEIINESRYEVKFNKGETIFKQGGPLTHVACITQGMAKIYLEGNKSKNIILKVARPADLVGGPGFQTTGRSSSRISGHHFSVSAINETRACFIDIQAFARLLKTSSPFAMEFIKHLNTITIQLYNKLMSLTQKQMHGRMADTLLYMSRVIYANNDFETTLTRQDIADMSAMTKESAIRIMKDLKDEGIIDCEANHFVILNEKQLNTISNTG